MYKATTLLNDVKRTNKPFPALLIVANRFPRYMCTLSAMLIMARTKKTPIRGEPLGSVLPKRFNREAPVKATQSSNRVTMLQRWSFRLSFCSFFVPSDTFSSTFVCEFLSQRACFLSLPESLLLRISSLALVCLLALLNDLRTAPLWTRPLPRNKNEPNPISAQPNTNDLPPPPLFYSAPDLLCFLPLSLHSNLRNASSWEPHLPFLLFCNVCLQSPTEKRKEHVCSY